jgi:hypothetical protein
MLVGGATVDRFVIGVIKLLIEPRFAAQTN